MIHHPLVNLLKRAWLPVAVALAVMLVVLLPLNLLSLQPLHHDEALYATWALQIASGQDIWLNNTWIDKPPLFLYTVAGALRLLGVTSTAARTPSLLASALIVGLIFWLGRNLYGRGAGVLAAFLTALSPFILLFAPTAFTDPMLVALVLAGCVSATYGRAVWAGVFMGLAIAAKQQAIFFIPLSLGFLIINPISNPQSPISGPISQIPHPKSQIFRFFIALILTSLPAFIWDLARTQPAGFLELSLAHYGDLTVDTSGFSDRWAGFVDLLTYGTASSVLNTLLVVGCPLLLLYGTIKHKTTPAVLSDWLIALFILAFLALHALFSFQVWDRYLLGLIPLLALLLARVLLLPWIVIKDYRPNTPSIVGAAWGISLFLLLALTMPRPVNDAVNARYPLGSQSQALRGIEQIVAYLQGHVGANSTLYHHWLGTHWRFYLWQYPYDLQYWDTPAELASKAQPGHLIALPTWRSETELRLALYNAGLGLTELTRAYAPNGAPTIILYQIEPATGEGRATKDK